MQSVPQPDLALQAPLLQVWLVQGVVLLHDATASHVSPWCWLVQEQLASLEQVWQ